MASVRRKRTVAIIFALCLVTALFLYKKGVRETWYGVNVRETGNGEFSRLDSPSLSTAALITNPIPTKMYSVVEYEDDGEDVGDVGTTENEKKERKEDEIKLDAERQKKDEIRDSREEISRTRENKLETKRELEGGKEGEIIKTEEKRKSYETKEQGRNEKTSVEEDVEEKKNIEADQTVEKPQRMEVGKDEMTGENGKRTEERMNKQGLKPGQRGLTFDSFTVASKATPIRQDMIRVTSTPISIGPGSSRATRNIETRGINGAAISSKTSKASWVLKTTEVNNPKRPKNNAPSVGRSPDTVQHSSTRAPSTTTSPKEEVLACKIPWLEPFHPHVSRLQNNVGTNLRKICRSMHPYSPVFKVVGNKLVLKKDIKEDSIVKNSIELREIRRDSDSHFNYKRHGNPFRGLSSLQESNDIGQYDFFRLDYKVGGRYASDLYARVSPKLDILQKQTELAKKFQNKGLPLNVLIIGFDSISRANFVRKLPRVLSFLQTELNTYFMEGMSVVGDATTPILTAMLTGKDETVLPEGRTSYNGKPIDNWPWIMKDYESQGYMTLYAEDDPSVSAFNLRLRGFSRSPTHHYMRPFWLSLEREHERDEPGRCSKSESMVNHTLKYVNSFFDAYPTSRKFAFAFHSYLAHAHPNHLSYAEEDLMWFLRTFVSKGYLKDTMLIIMGDHGSRNSEYRGTMQGKLEERLPWFSISLPSEFHRRFADLAANLRSNQAVIASSFDVHATLRHILTYPSLPSTEQTQSLFQKLPRARICQDAGIAEHWCPCFQWSPTDVNSKHAQSIAASAVKLINEKLSKVPELDSACHKLLLDSVVHAVTLRTNDKVQKFYSTDQDGDRRINYSGRTRDLLRYQIIFTTQPNNAKYEVTASVISGDKVAVNPEISRLNRYNDQPACIARQYPYARKFCHCRTSAAR